VFTIPGRISLTPACCQLQQGINLDHLEIEAYTDGSCLNNGKQNVRCRSSVWLGENHPRNMAVRIPGNKQSNRIGEIAAVIAAAESLPNYCKLTIVTDSRYIINGLTEHLAKWEDRGWIEIKIANLFKRAAYLLKRRTAPTIFKWVKGHQGNLGNKGSNLLAKEGAEKEEPDILSLEIPKEFNLQGAKLATLSQAIAYRGICEQKTITPCPATNRNLDITREAVMDYTGNSETNKTIWRSLRKHTIRLRVQQFLFKAMHSTPMIGERWSNIQGFEQRGECNTCRTIENMSHIMITCREALVTVVWELARKLWLHDRIRWPNLSIGIILGCACIEAQEGNHDRREGREWTADRQRGATRLLQILILEAAHLIWVMQCERVIQEKHHDEREIETRWTKAIIRRLTNDKITATIIKHQKAYTRLVETTWEDTLKKFSNLPDKWIHDSEVLVGRSVRRA
jgi:ribonuclease HI